MPHEPDKMMEELLRALVRKRREGAGAAPELHPATRRLLHSEITRVQRQQGSGSSTWWRCFHTWWARVAVATAMLAVLGVGSWWMGSGKRRDLTQMAKAAPEQASKQFSLAAAQSVSERLREKESKAESSKASEDAMQRQTELQLNSTALAGIAADRYSPALGAPGTEPGLPAAVRAEVREVPAQGVVDGVSHNKAANRSFLFTDALASADQTAFFAVSSTLSQARGIAKAQASVRPDPSTIAAGVDQPTYGLNTAAESPARFARFPTTNGREKADLGVVASGTLAYFMETPPATAPTSPRSSSGPDALSFSLAPSPPSPPPAAPPLPSVLTALGRRDTAEGLAASLAKPAVFVRIPAAGGLAGSRGLQSVLGEIAFEREGDAVSLREKDGSVYTGQVVRATEFAIEEESIAALGAERNGAIRARRPIAPTAGNTNQILFRVSGTNRVLREFVVFDGKISGRQLTEPGPMRTTTTTRTRQSSVNLEQESSQRTLRRLHGTAKVGTNRFEVDAEEVRAR